LFYNLKKQTVYLVSKNHTLVRRNHDNVMKVRRRISHAGR